MKIDYSIKKSLRDNFLYFVAFFALIGIILLVTVFYVGQFKSNAKRIADLQSEIDLYNKKRDLLEFKNQAVKDEVDLDHINQVLSQLIPAKEDYFSIIAALDKLSLQTNFIVTAYNIVVDKSTTEKLAILIEGQGDPNSFLEFLQEYNFSGGRLITIDKIEFRQEAFTGAKVSINVYTGKANETRAIAKLDDVNSELVERILQKVQIDLKNEDDEVSDYPTKSTPF